MLFSSSSFSVSMARIKECAAENLGILTKNDTINEIRAEISHTAYPNFDTIRQNLKKFTEEIIQSVNDSNIDFLFEVIISYEELYSQVCLELLKIENSRLTAEELALPYLVIDFYRAAATRFGVDIDELRYSEISFADAVEFICNLNMPKCLKDILSEYAACKITEYQYSKTPPKSRFDTIVRLLQSTFISYLDTNDSEWRIKADKPCALCSVELYEMHNFLKVIFKNIVAFDIPQYHPDVLDAPYTLDKLSKNLLLFECPFHNDIKQYEDRTRITAEDSLLYNFVSGLCYLANIRQDDPYKSIKIAYRLKLNIYAGNSSLFEQAYPWTKAYFLWFDALNAGEDKNDCILPDALKGSRDCTNAHALLKKEWQNFHKDGKDDTSLRGLKKYFSAPTHSARDFLKNKGLSCSTLSLLSEDEGIYWAKEIGDASRYERLFAESVPAVDDPVEKIGDYLQNHAADIKMISTFPNDLPPMLKTFRSSMVHTAREHFNALLKRIYDEMEHISGDENTPVFLRKSLLNIFAQLLKRCSSNNEYCNILLEKFRREHELTKRGNTFSETIREITEMRDAEENKHRAELAEAAAASRRKVLFEMSHSIKNLMASVSEPLDMLKDQLEGTQRRTVENALAGTGLIRDLAVGIHMSMRGEPGTWRKDVLEPGFGATTLDKIILDAVRHAVSNMFDGKYFAQFVKNYFGRDLNTFMQAQNEWKAAVSAEDTFACINKYFFDFKIDCGESQLNIPIGDRDSTATKLLILFQELFLNAVKYSSFTEREKRFVKLDIAITQKNWNIKLSNSAVGRQNVKSSGIGLAVIKNFAELFEAKYDASCKNDTYISNINFSLNK